MPFNQLKIAIVALGFAIPVSASAQSPPKTDQEYCSVLTREYDRYIASDHEFNYLAVAGYGKAQCKEHHARAAIPVLEHTLQQAKLPLSAIPASIAALAPNLTKTGARGRSHH